MSIVFISMPVHLYAQIPNEAFQNFEKSQSRQAQQADQKQQNDQNNQGDQKKQVWGRVASRNFYSTDNSTAFNSPDVLISFVETDLSAKNISSQKLDLEIDGTFILDMTQAKERRFGETERLDQFRQFSLAKKIGHLKLTLGRKVIFSAGNAWVDGLDASYQWAQKKATIGFYAGLSPDRFDRSFTLNYQASGLYFDWQSDQFHFSLAYNTIFFQKTLDRHYAFQRMHFQLLKNLFVSNYLVLELIKGPSTSTWLSALDYTPIKGLNFALHVTRYSLEQYRNQFIYRNIIEPNQALILGNEVINLVYQRIRFSASMTLGAGFYHYHAIEFKNRAQDGRNAWLYVIGIRNDDFLGKKIEFDLQAQVVNHFRSDTLLFALTLRKELLQSFFLEGRATSFSGRTLDQNTDRARIFDESQQIYLLGITSTYRFNQAHHFDLAYDGVFETELNDLKNNQNIVIHTGMFRYNYLF